MAANGTRLVFYSAPLRAGIVALVNATMQLVIAAGVHVSANLNAAITGFVNTVLLVLLILLHDLTIKRNGVPANGAHE